MARADAHAASATHAQRVVGTAGHIDHGKTALVRALTGVDTDRLPEEKARGITIDLGFAALELGDSRVSIVDVPGHEKLVRTMVSGAAGIDVLLLVVAADEGVMPQTREHVAICELLGIQRGVVALTKRDAVDEEMCELASEEVRDLLAEGGLAGAAIVPVSSTTGDGIDALRAALAEAVDSCPPRTSRTGPPRLAIDRAFAVRGFGSVVTGTLVGDAFTVGEPVCVFPMLGQAEAKARIRGLQVHDESVERAEPGQRCAINLQGLELADIKRGQVVSRPGALEPTETADVELLWLDAAPTVDDVVSIEFLSGTSERRARLAPIGVEPIRPGGRCFARLHIDGAPVALLPGDRFIARGFARIHGTGGTLGGGVVLDVAPPHRRRSDPALLSDLDTFVRGDTSKSIRVRVTRTGLEGILESSMVPETGLSRDELSRHLGELESAGDVVRAGLERWLSTPSLDRMESQLIAALDDFHRAEPLRPGMARAALKGRLPGNVHADAAERALSRLEESGRLASEGDLVRRPDFRPTLDPDGEQAVERIRKQAVESGLEPPNPREWADHLGITLERFRDLVAHLERNEILIRAPGDLWFDRTAIDELRDRLVTHLREHGEIDTQSYKALIDTTRRTAMPLMELFDELHVTRRKGDVRVLRA